MHSPNGLRAIFFDLDGTLRHDHPNGIESFMHYAREAGLVIDRESALKGERWIYDYWAESSELKADFEKFGTENEVFWLNYTGKQLWVMGVADPSGDLAAAIHKRFREEFKPVHHVPADVAPTLRALRAHGYVVGLVSNRSNPLVAICEELGFIDLFHFTLSAGEANSWKPDRGIFDRAAQLAGIPNGAAAYVGDNYYADILGSANAGLKPILIDPRGLFPEAECAVVRSIGEVPNVLG